MKKSKVLISLAVMTCILSLFTSCGSEEKEKTAQNEVGSAAETIAPKKSVGAITAANVSIPEAKKITGTAVKTAKKRSFSDTTATTVTPRSYSHSDKAFKLKDCTTSLFMVNGWEILSGGTATDQQCDEITSFPAVLQYLDTKTTLTITVVDESEEKESFLAGTEETYISAYGSAYDSIDITKFEQLSIDEYDSFKIKANVVIKGESFTMIHILSNDVSGKSFSWMLLDSDGQFEDFNLAEAISYPKIMDDSLLEKFKRIDRENLDDLYKVNKDDYLN